jgi:hypothetical protein
MSTASTRSVAQAKPLLAEAASHTQTSDQMPSDPLWTMHAETASTLTASTLQWGCKVFKAAWQMAINRYRHISLSISNGRTFGLPNSILSG